MYNILSISKEYHTHRTEKQEIKKWRKATDSSTAENREVSTCQNSKQHTRQMVDSVANNDKNEERHYYSTEISASFGKVWILEPELVVEPNDFHTARSKTGEKFAFERTVLLDTTSVASSTKPEPQAIVLVMVSCVKGST